MKACQNITSRSDCFNDNRERSVLMEQPDWFSVQDLILPILSAQLSHDLLVYEETLLLILFSIVRGSSLTLAMLYEFYISLYSSRSGDAFIISLFDSFCCLFLALGFFLIKKSAIVNRQNTISENRLNIFYRFNTYSESGEKKCSVVAPVIMMIDAYWLSGLTSRAEYVAKLIAPRL